MKREILDDNEINERLKTLNGWRAEGGNLKKRFTFQNFAEGLDFVNRVGAIAETLDHHPDITFGWGYAELATTTHDRGGITDVDFSLLAEIDQI
jgi:4a-hydroxytetrahydrobiopterin dehydratase